jgi:hypothetical protein
MAAHSGDTDAEFARDFTVIAAPAHNCRHWRSWIDSFGVGVSGGAQSSAAR